MARVRCGRLEIGNRAQTPRANDRQGGFRVGLHFATTQRFVLRICQQHPCLQSSNPSKPAGNRVGLPLRSREGPNGWFEFAYRRPTFLGGSSNIQPDPATSPENLPRRVSRQIRQVYRGTVLYASQTSLGSAHRATSDKHLEGDQEKYRCRHKCYHLQQAEMTVATDNSATSAWRSIPSLATKLETTFAAR